MPPLTPAASPHDFNSLSLPDAALAYARMDLRVFPLIPGDKRPLGALAPNGFKDATTDLDQIAAWWQRWPDANIGTPVPDGHLVVDVDVGHGGTLDQLGAVPTTVKARTGGGGWHLWTTIPPDVKLTGKFRELTGIDVRKVGNYVVLPPSVHPSGTTYQWERPPFAETPIAPLPLRLLDRVREQPRPVPTRPDVTPAADWAPDEDELQRLGDYWLEQAVAKCEAGASRNETGLWLACQLRDNRADMLTAEGVLLVYAARVTDLGDHPYTEEESLGSLRQAYSRPPREPTSFGEVREDSLLPDASPTPASAGERIIAPQSLCDLLHRDLPPIKWAVPDLIPQGLTILAGRPKVGKSWLGLGLAIAVGTAEDRGRAFGRVATESGRVLYLALEDTPRRLRERTLRILGADAATWQGTVDFENAWEPLDKGGYTRLDTYLTAHLDTRLVIVDTFAKIRPTVRSKSGVSYDEDYRAMTLLKTLADQHETAIVAIHHTRKGAADDPQDLVSGTTGLTGAADSTLVLFRPRRGQEGEVKLFMTGRDIEEQELGLVWNEQTCTWVVTGEAAEALDLSALQRRVVGFFRSQHWEPCRQIDILRGAGLDTTKGGKGYKLLGRMLDKGALRHSGREKVCVAGYLKDVALPSPAPSLSPSNTHTTLPTTSNSSNSSNPSNADTISPHARVGDELEPGDAVGSVGSLKRDAPAQAGRYAEPATPAANWRALDATETKPGCRLPPAVCTHQRVEAVSGNTSRPEPDVWACADCGSTWTRRADIPADAVVDEAWPPRYRAAAA